MKISDFVEEIYYSWICPECRELSSEYEDPDNLFSVTCEHCGHEEKLED
jgi:DNA-directed RNA polymerase subunit RPC12/RpoP